MCLLNKPYSDLVLKNQKKVAVASILSKNFQRYCTAPFFVSGDAKVSCLYLSDQLFLELKPGEKLECTRMLLRTVRFYRDGKCTTKFHPVKLFRLIIYSHAIPTLSNSTRHCFKKRSQR